MADGLMAAANEMSPDSANQITVPKTDDELYEAIRHYTGISIPRVKVCDDHVAPFTALADAYFARNQIAVWLASRGFGGKSMLLAVLSFMEATTLGAAVNLIGGSGKQAKNIHDYMTGEHENVPNTFWKHENAPRHLLISDPSQYITKLNNFGRIDVSMASSTSIRGPHSPRLRIDEVDELSISLLDAALGQPMEVRGIVENTVLSSTHQYPDGTMTEVLNRAASNDFPVYRWCYRESVAGGWLTQEQVDRKRATITTAMWENEYELQEPSPENRSFDPDRIKGVFSRELGDIKGLPGEYVEFEPPDSSGIYATAADWAKKQDWTIIVTARIDVEPIQIVAFERMGRMAWPIMIDRYNARLKRYRHPMVLISGNENQIVLASHDATGVGDVVNDYLSFPVLPIIMMGRRRSEMINSYVAAVEAGEYRFPMIDFMYREHRTANYDNLFGTGHLPDTIAAMSCLHWLLTRPIKIVQNRYQPVRIGR